MVRLKGPAADKVTHNNIRLVDSHDMDQVETRVETSVPLPPRSTQPSPLARLRGAWAALVGQTDLPPSSDGRHIPLRVADPASSPAHLVDERRGHGRPYIRNVIRTSRYTVLNFVPKQLLFQFTRVGNFYFLCIGVPQTIPGVSTTGNYTTILPLLFFVLLTIAKEGYDDYKRHRLDTIENASLAAVLRPVNEPSAPVQPWSWTDWYYRLRRRSPPPPPVHKAAPPLDPEIAAGLHWAHVEWRHLRVGDVVRLTRDEEVPADLVLLHATGEGGLAYVETMALDGETNLKSKQVPAPLADDRCASIERLAACSAALVVEDPNADLYRFDGRIAVDKETLPLTTAEVLYRGCTLRNTPSAIGLIINAGEECKSRMNANRDPRAKKPALEHVTNGIVLVLAAYVVFLSGGCSIGYLLWHRATERVSWYLNDATVSAGNIIVGFAIQFNNVIPLALYVSLEIVKLGQMLLLNSDRALYDAASDTPAQCNTNTILEDLGQIGYVFSDKTGTLTENVMKFRKLSVAGTSWLHEADLRQLPPLDQRHDVAPAPTTSRLSTSSRVLPSRTDPPMSDAASTLSPTERRSSSVWRSTGRPDHAQPVLTTDDLIEYIRLRPYTPFARRVVTYILALALCHTCLPEREDGRVVGFQASSPDELALVTAAEDLGFLVVQRTAQSTTLRFVYNHSDQEETYEIVDVIEFSSQRKRMSVIVRRPDGKLWLICKGADSVVLPRLQMASLAMQKARDVRKSADLERAMIRKSEQPEPRGSIGGRTSVVLRRSIAKDGNVLPMITIETADDQYGGPRPSLSDRSRSLDIRRMARRSADVPRSMSTARAPSLDMDRTKPAQRPLRMLVAGARPALPDKFAFLEDGSVTEDEGAIFSQCFKHCDDFAAEGLRTLLFAHKFLAENEYRAWKADFLTAATSLDDRQERIEAVAETLEQNLHLLGASAIEDKLQKGVPDTVDKLRRANIKIWMLTGDKRETAINIAHSARICRPTSELYILDASRGDLAGQILHIAESLGIQGVDDTDDGMRPRRQRSWHGLFRPRQRPSLFPTQRRNHTVVVIDGQTLGVLEKQSPQSTSKKAAPSMSIFSADPDLRQLFYRIIPEVDAVICCRASPSQKALLVRSIRQGNERDSRWQRQDAGLTLAIGDGANDLAMLAEAHVGVGVSGREGLQAARVADYSIAQFRFLGRLLLVHGRWNYMRTAQFILSTFWKEMFFYTPAAAYQWYCGYTGTSIYESWSLTVLNTLFTSLCVIVPAIVEQDLGPAVLVAVPELYAFGQRSEGLNPAKYMLWMLLAVAQGIFVWFGCWAGYGAYANSADQGLFALGDLIFGVCIIWTNLRLLLLNTHHKSLPVLFACFITVGGWWLWNIFISLIYGDAPSPYGAKGGFLHVFGCDLSWWLTTIIMLTILSAVELFFRTVHQSMRLRHVWRGRLGWRSVWKWARSWAISRHEEYGDGGEVDVEMPAEELDLRMWQILEKDPVIQERLRLINGTDDEEEEARSWGFPWKWNKRNAEEEEDLDG